MNEVEKAKQDILDNKKNKPVLKKQKQRRIDSRIDAMIRSEKYNKRLYEAYDLIKLWGARNGYRIPKTFDLVFEEFMETHKNDFPNFKLYLEHKHEYDL